MNKTKHSDVVANNSNIVLVKIQQLQQSEQPPDNEKPIGKSFFGKSTFDHSSNRITFFRLVNTKTFLIEYLFHF